MPTTDPNGTTSSDTLHGWKEIANHLGRSTRAVQRWEIELRLPVHRLKGAEGQTVYALRNEIDEWKKSRDLPKLHTDEIEEVSSASALSSVAPQSHHATATRNQWLARRWMWQALFAALTLAVGVGLGNYIHASPIGDVVTMHAGGTKVVANDAAGREVWTRDMGHMVGLMTERSLLPSGSQKPIRRLGKDGPILVVLQTIPGNQSTIVEETLVAFETDGRIRWQFSPATALTCGSESFGPPWQISSVIISAHGPRPTALVSVTHHTWWPSEVFEIDQTGRATLRYRQAGWIWSLAEWSVGGKRLLGIGGVLNEYAKASLTLVDLDGDPATAPHSDARFGCGDSPRGQPVRVFLFPIMDVRVLGPYALTSGIRVLGNIMQAHTDESGGESVLEIDEHLHPSRFALPDGYWVVHRSLESKHLLPHPADACPEAQGAHTIDEWNPAAGWSHTTIKPAVRPTSPRVSPSPNAAEHYDRH